MLTSLRKISLSLFNTSSHLFKQYNGGSRELQGLTVSAAGGRNGVTGVGVVVGVDGLAATALGNQRVNARPERYSGHSGSLCVHHGGTLTRQHIPPIADSGRGEVEFLGVWGVAGR